MSPPERRELPRPLLWVGVPLAGLVLVGLFLHLSFPYDRLRARLETEAGRALGARVRIAELAPRLSTRGPSLEARGVRVEHGGRDWLRADVLALRPALDAAWLRADPAFRAWLTGPLGAAEGTFTLGGRVRARLRDVSLDAWPAGALWPGASLSGRLSGEVTVTPGDEAVHLEVDATTREGSFQSPETGIAVPLEALEADLRLAAGNLVEIETLALRGPMLRVRVRGRLGPGPSLEAAPLRVSLEVEGDPSVLRALANAGVPVQPGRGPLQVAGTLRRPVVR